MTTAKEVGLDSTLGERKNALLAHQPNSRTQQLKAAQVAYDHATDPDDARTLIEALFQPPRPERIPDTPATAEHPAACRCKPCGARRTRNDARRRAAADPSVVPHGTPSGYDYWGCRCRDCANRHTASVLASRANKRRATA